eukprot:COSAG01_NODE_9521_length_2421_cov_9.437123_3_plen_85_part_00
MWGLGIEPEPHRRLAPFCCFLFFFFVFIICVGITIFTDPLAIHDSMDTISPTMRTVTHWTEVVIILPADIALQIAYKHIYHNIN